MSDELDNKTDAELNAAFAVEVAGWKLDSALGSGMSFFVDTANPQRIRHKTEFTFCGDANAVQPFIEKQFMVRSHFGACAGMMPWIVEVQPKVDSKCLFTGHGKTFARAACIALLKAKRAT